MLNLADYYYAKSHDLRSCNDNVVITSREKPVRIIQRRIIHDNVMDTARESVPG